jgi:hypothetical protein
MAVLQKWQDETDRLAERGQIAPKIQAEAVL